MNRRAILILINIQSKSKIGEKSNNKNKDITRSKVLLIIIALNCSVLKEDLLTYSEKIFLLLFF
jgi:hypothetical protein